ncbi:hypothetical protein [Calderihabitans maritimus]|uniref:Uncharacterized protein n=1 Tax=Calderihabitans maritimus TaxID=1246530 RepID=A0A1Z5HY05_9FIRM|nr:hypothetical protein [Calderihabitans maritimus]GAW94298.1 hypothetical protein Dtox_3183 [Calderihabitans maritimus]
MVLPVRDERHQLLNEYVQSIAGICLSEEFIKLRRELEEIYAATDGERAKTVAFQDALYAIMAQSDFLLYETYLRHIKG